MKEYIFINRVPSKYGPAEAKKVTESWKQVTDQWKESEVFVASFVLPIEGMIAKGTPVNLSVGNVLADELKIVSIIIVKAESIEAAANMAVESPILQQFGSIEIKEIMGRPS